ncbi:MAG: TonB-dependent receptor domain-containing protein [Luteibaculaceae bacterium]
MRILTLAFLLFTGFTTLYAQNASISGTIFSNKTGDPVAYATIYIEETGTGGVSLPNGRFKVNSLTPNIYNVRVSSLGFFTQTLEVDLRENPTRSIEIILQEKINDLPQFVVRSNSITGGKSGIKEMPGSAYYISPRELQMFNYTDINRTLRNVPGVNILEEDGFGLRPNIGLRGASSERTAKITIMEDGILMAPAPYAAPAAYYFPTVGRMHAVEVLKGASQIQHGPFTTGGAINLISTPIPDKLSGKVSMLAGSFGSRNVHTHVGNDHGQVAYLFETFQHSADGFKELDNGGPTGFTMQDYLAKVRVNTKKDAKYFQSLTLKVAQSREISDETYLGLSREDFDRTPFRRYAASQKDQMTTSQNQIVATHYIKLGAKAGLTTQAYRTEFSRNWYKLHDITDDNGTRLALNAVLRNPEQFQNAFDILNGTSSGIDNSLRVRANNREYCSQGIQTTYSQTLQTEKASHTLDVSLRLHRDEMDRFQKDDFFRMENGTMFQTREGVFGTESNRIATADAVAAFAQYTLKTGNLTVSPGVRTEIISLKQDNFGSNDPGRTGENLVSTVNEVAVILPGLGVNYNLTEYANVFAGIHQGFSPPGTNPETESEKSWNYELGLRLNRKSLNFEVVGFFNDYSNLLGADMVAAGGLGTGDLFNGGAAQTFGLEVLLHYNLLERTANDLGFAIPIQFTYTYTDARFLNTFESTLGYWGMVASGDFLPYLARNQAALNIGLEHQKYAFFFNARYVDPMRIMPGQDAINQNNATDMQLVLDLSARYIINKNVSLFASVNNLTNQIYTVNEQPAGWRPGMPRFFNGGVMVNF